MGYRLSEINGQVTVQLIGDMDMRSVAVLREELSKMILAGKLFYAFNMTGLRYIDSAGLGMLIAVQKKVAPQGGQVVIRGLHGVIRELFEQTRLDKIFTIEEPGVESSEKEK